MTSVSVEQATAFSPARQFALFDAGGLSDEQRQMLPPHGSEGAHWFYAGLDDPRALDMGPVLVQATERMLSLVEQLWADSAVRWASSILVSKLSMERVFWAGMPFFLALLVATAAMTVFPGIITWLPALLMG